MPAKLRIGSWFGAAIMGMLLAMPLHAQERERPDAQEKERPGQRNPDDPLGRQPSQQLQQQHQPQQIATEMRRHKTSLHSATTKAEVQFGPALSARAVLIDADRWESIQRESDTGDEINRDRDRNLGQGSNLDRDKNQDPKMDKDRAQGSNPNNPNPQGQPGQQDTQDRDRSRDMADRDDPQRDRSDTGTTPGMNRNTRLVFEITCIDEHASSSSITGSQERPGQQGSGQQPGQQLPGGRQADSVSGEVILVYVDGQTGKLFKSSRSTSTLGR